jgi:FKBP-type peptidyl-prolyl cis-trans isomerase
MPKHDKNNNHQKTDHNHIDQKIEENNNLNTSKESTHTEIKITEAEISKEQTKKVNKKDREKKESNKEEPIMNSAKVVSKNSEDMILEDDYAQIEPAITDSKNVSEVEMKNKAETAKNYIYDNNETKPNQLILKTVFLLAILSVLGIFVLVGGNFSKPNSSTTNPDGSTKIDKKPCLANNKKMDIPTNLKIQDTLVGSGKEVFSGCEIKIHYKGYLVQTQQEIGDKIEPKEFDNSFKRGAPFSTQIGVGKLIKGWDIGIIGMKEGGKRKLTIPSELAYGDIELPGIPAKSTLVFEVELIQVLD